MFGRIENSDIYFRDSAFHLWGYQLGFVTSQISFTICGWKSLNIISLIHSSFSALKRINMIQQQWILMGKRYSNNNNNNNNVNLWILPISNALQIAFYDIVSTRLTQISSHALALRKKKRKKGQSILKTCWLNRARWRLHCNFIHFDVSNVRTSKRCAKCDKRT